MVQDVSNERAKEKLKSFLEANKERHRARLAIAILMKRVLSVQDKMRNKLASKYGKIEVLSNQWDKIFGQIQITATRKNEVEGDKFCM